MIEIKNISYSYPHQSEKVLKELNYSINSGDVVLVTGASGCGKSTFMRCLNGLIPHYFQGDLDGEIIIDGVDTKGETIPEISQKVGSLFQDPEQQFFTLDVESEIAFGHEQRGVEPNEITKVIDEIVNRLGLTHVLKSSIFTLSEGEKQKTALASILSLKPKAILLDEPTANLDHESTLQLAMFVKELKKEGITIIIVDHRLYWLNDIADHVWIMKEGAVVRNCNFSGLFDDELRAQFGLRSPDIVHLNDTIKKLPKTDNFSGDVVSVSNLTFGYKGKELLFDNEDFQFPLGHVTAIVGSNGCGKTTLARILTGLNRVKSGNILIDNEAVSTKQLCKKAGLVFQNSDHQLFMNTVTLEMEIAGLTLSKDKRTEKASSLLEHFNLKQFASAHPQSLSGGQKQRLVIACALMKEPEILILDEPTSGLDGKNMSIISHTLKQIAKLGTCVIVITHDLELISSASDYILDLNNKEES